MSEHMSSPNGCHPDCQACADEMTMEEREQERAEERLRDAAPDMLKALEMAGELVRLARRYFPKSIKHGDRFKLEQTCAAITSAIKKGTK